ncbi:hypothetical protein I6M32_16195 [Shewanella algae]|uniref:hypothetical protein n=1 Tax=Shewanella algae TaxID=38313 RepID=UPI001AAC71E8|nr:hypothetical protein [Shewanella algae]MBO2613095.1 hypothetical protein [Shewanella algae]
MKQQNGHFVLRGLVTTIAVLCCSVVTAEEDKTLKSEFERVSHSFFGGEMIFSCGFGGSTFKISSGIFSKPTLYWKSGIEWQELDDAMFKDAGVIFRGLGREGGVPLKELKFEVDLPIFNSGSSYNKKNAKDYFIKSRDTGFVPFEYTLDTIRGRLTSTNVYPIHDHARLDAEKYVKDQSNIGFSIAFTVEQQAEEDRRKKARRDAISAVIEQFGNEFEVVTPVRGFEAVDYCSLEK